jgi:GrpB protein
MAACPSVATGMTCGRSRWRVTGWQPRWFVHVVPASSPEVTAMRGFRDALRADPILRRRYAALKRAIVAGGPVDPVMFSNAKHEWIAATLDQLGLTNGRQRRLYEDAPSLESTRRAS